MNVNNYNCNNDEVSDDFNKIFVLVYDVDVAFAVTIDEDNC